MGDKGQTDFSRPGRPLHLQTFLAHMRLALRNILLIFCRSRNEEKGCRQLGAQERQLVTKDGSVKLRFKAKLQPRAIRLNRLKLELSLGSRVGRRGQIVDRFARNRGDEFSPSAKNDK